MVGDPAHLRYQRFPRSAVAHEPKARDEVERASIEGKIDEVPAFERDDSALYILCQLRCAYGGAPEHRYCPLSSGQRERDLTVTASYIENRSDILIE
jgi:hypothetical protein